MSTEPCLVENPTTPTIEYPIGTSAATSISFVTLGAIAVFGPSLFWVLMDWDRESYRTSVTAVHRYPVFPRLHLTSPLLYTPT